MRGLQKSYRKNANESGIELDGWAIKRKATSKLKSQVTSDTRDRVSVTG